ncbi:sterol O-acyltransferase 1 [Niveomyces insectorum RCEF 264]|uniref:Sterol O-acyltransferase 1 n=1 Tax=Niveomyces insectorum RCEF 264 TaxID=1081102 RepID=A0A162I9H8_9HYPO|nr:sterol O-acyltransferase 1 [Niveomyces insectorum RCEF 264]
MAGDESAATAEQRPNALRDALRAAGAARAASFSGSEDASLTASESASEEDYDELTRPRTETMVLRQRRRRTQTQLRNEVQPVDAKAAAATADTATSTATATSTPPHHKQNGAAQTAQRYSGDVDAAALSATPSSRQQRDGRKLSATVIFEEKNGSTLGTASLSSAARAVGSSPEASVAGADGEAGGLLPGGRSGKSDRRSFVVSIDDPKLAEILRADLQQMREDMDERRLNQAEGTQAEQQAQDMTATAEAEREPTKAGNGAALAPRPQHRKRKPRRGRFGDFVFTRSFSTFDRQNAAAANSPFHGFFTLFWICVFLFMVRIGARNWRQTGSPLGNNEIMATMFHRDVIVLLLSDGVMCALTGVSWLLQLVVHQGRVMDWDGSGWVVQNLWQALFIAGVIGWTQLRDWPWSHTVFFVLHGLVMLMKQHSYAFYNGYLSTLYKRRAVLQARLRELEEATAQAEAEAEAGTGVGPECDNDNTGADIEVQTRPKAAADSSADAVDKESDAVPSAPIGPTASTTKASSVNPESLDKVVAALQAGQPLDHNQARVFARILHWEIDGLTEELRGKATRPERAYPHNLTFANHYEYIVLPTVVYELEYPRSESINWQYAAEKLVAVFGIIFVMIMVSQAFIYPVVMQTVAMKEAGMPLSARFKAFPWMLSDLIFPFLMEYLLTWYLIWETILNFLAEVTYFADRNFYAAWWNSVTWDEFARDWNRPVHLFLLRHVYHSSISAMKVNKHTATLITFFLSACVHELVMWCIFKKLRGYLLFLQMCQLPLVRMSRTKWLRNRQTLGNVLFWLGLLMGPSVLCSLYLIL